MFSIEFVYKKLKDKYWVKFEVKKKEIIVEPLYLLLTNKYGISHKSKFKSEN